MRRGHVAALSIVVLMVVLGASGCAWVTVRRVRADNFKSKGVRYWLPAPYLLVRAQVEVARTDEIYWMEVGGNVLTPMSEGVVGMQAPAQSAPALSGAPAPPEPRSKGKKPTATGPATPPADKKDGDGEKAPGASEAPGEPPPPASLSDAVALIWLPDYCQQYAVKEKSFMAKLDAKVSLGDGWKLSEYTSSADSTALLSKVIELAGTVVGARKDIAVARIEAKTPPAVTVEGGPKVKGVAPKYLRKTTVQYLKPGLYPISSGQGPNCDALPQISAQSFVYETGVFWSELTFAK